MNVDPTVVTEIIASGNSVHQPGSPGWNQSGSCMTVVSNDVEQHQKEHHSQVDLGPEVSEDLLESLFKESLSLTEEDAIEASARAAKYFSETQLVTEHLDAAATSELLEEAKSAVASTPNEHQRAPRMNLVDPEEKRRRKMDLNKDASKRYREKQKRKRQQ